MAMSHLSGPVLNYMCFLAVKAWEWPTQLDFTRAGPVSNVLDLLFMGIFLILCIVTHILYQDNDDVNTAVNVLGYFSFMLFCFIAVYHFYDYRIKETKVGRKLHYKLLHLQRDYFQKCKYFTQGDDKESVSMYKKQDVSESSQYRESFLQHHDFITK